jgi:hypothetical protein
MASSISRPSTPSPLNRRVDHSALARDCRRSGEFLLTIYDSRGRRGGPHSISPTMSQILFFTQITLTLATTTYKTLTLKTTKSWTANDATSHQLTQTMNKRLKAKPSKKVRLSRSEQATTEACWKMYLSCLKARKIPTTCFEERVSCGHRSLVAPGVCQVVLLIEQSISRPTHSVRVSTTFQRPPQAFCTRATVVSTRQTLSSHRMSSTQS